jgi:hypothetical protein
MKRFISLLMSMAFVLALGLGSSALGQENEEQRIINSVPSKVPIKIEIINGDMKSALQDIEIKVTNISNRPIYYLDLSLASAEEFMPRHRVGVGTRLTIGNSKLADYSQSVDHFRSERANTIPFEPGDSKSFSVPKEKAAGFWRVMVDKGYSRDAKLVLELQTLSFGDRSGLFTRDAIEMPTEKIVDQEKPTKESFDFFLPR